jgi:hypothetical protein
MCFTAPMRRLTYGTLTLVIVAAISILSGCNRPVSDAEQLRTIRAEAQNLMKTHAPTGRSKWMNVPRDQWPTAITSLHPEAVTVHVSGVDIMTKSYFDGGYGYEVPRSKADLLMPAACYSELSQGVFWHGPC